MFMLKTKTMYYSVNVHSVKNMLKTYRYLEDPNMCCCSVKSRCDRLTEALLETECGRWSF